MYDKVMLIKYLMILMGQRASYFCLLELSERMLKQGNRRLLISWSIDHEVQANAILIVGDLDFFMYYFYFIGNFFKLFH